MQDLLSTIQDSQNPKPEPENAPTAADPKKGLLAMILELMRSRGMDRNVQMTDQLNGIEEQAR